MKRIQKDPEPNLLVQYRATPLSSYGGLNQAVKDQLRTSLQTEQGHLCCYCTKRIPEKIKKDENVTYEMKIEHFQSQAHFPQYQLTYANLFGACTGNEGKPKHLQTCDTFKGDLVLSLNPTSTNPDCESIIKYDAEGRIYSDNEDITNQLEKVLNLNMQSLKDQRKEVYLEVQKRVEAEGKAFADNPLKIRFFEREREKWLNLTNNKYKPFCMVAVYYLNKKIRQAQS